MITGIASLIFVPLLAIALVHLMWAFGSTWPVKDQKTLAQTVVGFRDVQHMPPRYMSALVALFILAAGLWVLALTDPSDAILLTLGGFALAAIFLVRGGFGFTAMWRELTPQEPFATFDKKLYSPLCLGIGAGFLFLSVWRIM